MRRCILCGEPMVMVAENVLVHVSELASLLARADAA